MRIYRNKKKYKQNKKNTCVCARYIATAQAPTTTKTSEHFLVATVASLCGSPPKNAAAKHETIVCKIIINTNIMLNF